MSEKKISRRVFIASSTAAVLAAGEGHGQNRQERRRAKTKAVSPNEKLNIASIGVSGQGRTDVHRCKDEKIVALCDVDWNWAARTFSEFPEARKYTDYREMLDKEKDIDAVTITTPDHFHAVAAMYAMEMGKHVYVQKPLTYSIGEARALTEAARKYGVVTQMGNQGHSQNGVRKLCEMIWNGDIGQVHEAHMWTNRPIWPQGVGRPEEVHEVPDTLDWDLWLGPAPERPYNDKYLPFKWRGWWDFGCGALGDMACHIADPGNWALKLSDAGPTSVEVISQEGNNSETYPTKCVIRYEFPKRGDMDPVTVYWYDGGNLPPLPVGLPEGTIIGERDGKNGSLFIGTEGIATCHTYSENPRLLPDERMAYYEWPEETIERVPKQNHYRNWIDAIKNGVQACSSFDYAGPFTEWVLLGNLALKYDRKLEWDAKNMRVTNVPEANEHIMREYREGWSLKGLRPRVAQAMPSMGDIKLFRPERAT